jgi:hypothetical protein
MNFISAVICGVLLAGSPIIGSPAFVLAARPPLLAGIGESQERVFNDVEKGVAAGSVATFSRHLGPRVFVQLPESAGAHYSAHQAFYVIDLFLKNHTVLGVKFTTFGTSESTPYATGHAGFLMKGVRQDTQVYVALARVGDRWMITHLSIY